MPPTDDRTTNRNWPKPSPLNSLAEDVPRIREFMDTLDAEAMISVIPPASGAAKIKNVINISQANYDALGTKDPNTLYVIT